MSDYFDALESELRAAVPRAARRWRPGMWRWRPAPGALGAAVAAAVAVAVVVGALGLLRHGAAPSAQRPPRPHPANTAGQSPTLRQLLDSFAVLRRPATAADRSWRGPGDDGTRFIVTRQAARLSDGDRVFLRAERSLRRSIDGPGATLSIWVVHPDGDADGADFAAQDQYNVMPLPSPMRVGRRPGPGTVTWVGLVPDGVSAVRWTFACPRAARVRCADRGTLTATTTVADNVAFVTGVTGSGLCAECRSPVSVTWYGVSGRPVFAYSAGRGRNLVTPPFVKDLPAAQPVVRRVLAANGLAGVRFGATPQQVTRTLTPLIGAPDQTWGGGGLCGVNRSLVWPAWSSPSSEPRPASRLLAYFSGTRFVGYEYGHAGARTAAQLSGIGVRLATARGLTAGDALARGRALYGGGAFAISAAQDGTWRIGSRGTGLRGYSWKAPGSGPLNPRNLVASIDAGDVGCPAVSP